MDVVVNVATFIKSELLLDADGVAVTTKVNADWTKVATLLGVGTTVIPTITHRANGYYDIAAPFPTVGNWSVEYSVVVNGETVWFDPQLVQVVTAAQADPAAAIASGGIAVSSPVALTGDVTMFQGDDQKAVDSRALGWATTDTGTWSDLTGASIVLQGTHKRSGATMSATGSVTTPTGATKAVRVELTHAETAALDAGVYAIQVIATLASGHVVTLVGGTDDDPVTLTVIERKGA